MTETVYRETTIDEQTLRDLIDLAQQSQQNDPLISRAKSILHRVEQPTRYRTIRDVCADALDDFKDRIDNYDGDDDDISEIADSNVPIYTMDLIRLCMDRLDLLCDEPEIGPAETPLQAIQYNVYDCIYQHLHDYWENRPDDEDEDDTYENEDGTVNVAKLAAHLAS